MSLESLEKLRSHLWMAPLTQRVEQHASLFGQIMERISIDTGAEVWERYPRGLAAAARRCLWCRNSTACQQWLESERSNAAPPICPNAAFFSRVRMLEGAA